MRARYSIRGFVRSSVGPSVRRSMVIAPAHLSATGIGRVSGLVNWPLACTTHLLHSLTRSLNSLSSSWDIEFHNYVFTLKICSTATITSVVVTENTPLISSVRVDVGQEEVEKYFEMSPESFFMPSQVSGSSWRLIDYVD